MAVDGDFGAGVQPADVIGGRAHDLDPGVGKPHGPHPLPGRSHNTDMDRFCPGFPQPPPQPMLAKGFDFEMAITALHRFLNALLHQSRFEPQPVFHSGYAIIVLTIHCFLPNLTVGSTAMTAKATASP